MRRVVVSVMSDREPERLMDRFVGFCSAILLGSMALYGAISIVESVWVPLCVAIAIALAVGITVWLIVRNTRRW